MEIKDRFLKYVNKDGPLVIDTPCWLWTGGDNGKCGYGNFWWDQNTRQKLAHRASYEFFVGAIPSGSGYHGTCVLHKCDTKKCVNPNHLFLGSNKQNMLDKVQKNRQARGESFGTAKLTEKEVLEIRSKYIPVINSLGMLAKEYNVSNPTIYHIVKRKTWKHI